MGQCFSLHLSAAGESTRSIDSPTARVISINGDLREYALPISASQVLDSETSFSTSPTSACFLCNSDGLSYDDYIPALRPYDVLSDGQMYFVLPTSKLQSRLAASDMAALAVKASVSLRNAEDRGSSRGRRRRRKSNRTQISPILLANNNSSGGDYYKSTSVEDGGLGYDPSKTVKSFDSELTSIDRMGSVRKMKRVSSRRRMKLAVRSFRMRLSTIYEGYVL